MFKRKPKPRYFFFCCVCTIRGNQATASLGLRNQEGRFPTNYSVKNAFKENHVDAEDIVVTNWSEFKSGEDWERFWLSNDIETYQTVTTTTH